MSFKRMMLLLAIGLSCLALLGCDDDDGDEPQDTAQDTAVDTAVDTEDDTAVDTEDDTAVDTEDDTAVDTEDDTAVDTEDDADMVTLPPPPALGTQIDRMGRAGITTALIGTFLTDETEKGDLKDAYNAALPPDWPTFTPEIQSNLGIYDGLDTVCGNQLLAAAELTADRYATLAGALTNDRLHVDTTVGTCSTYFGYELGFLGVIETPDCGGRTPLYDVIDVTYSALAAGMLSGVGDGVDADDATHSTTVFPYLAAPQ